MQPRSGKEEFSQDEILGSREKKKKKIIRRRMSPGMVLATGQHYLRGDIKESGESDISPISITPVKEELIEGVSRVAETVWYLASETLRFLLSLQNPKC